MNVRRFCLITLALSLLPLVEGEAQRILYPLFRPADVRFDNFAIENGKREPSGLSIIQDRKGFIWCGTELGLYRFDGIRYIRYGPGRSDSTLRGFNVRSVFEDSEGAIWAGTVGALNRLNRNSGTISHFIPDTADAASLNNTVRLIREDREGMLWLITDKDIFRFNRRKESFTRYQLDHTSPRSAITEINIDAERFLNDSKGRIWIGTYDGLYLYNPVNDSWKKVIPDGKIGPGNELLTINCISEDDAGIIWVGTETRGLLRSDDPEKGYFSKINIPKSGNKLFSSERVTAIFPGSSGSLWLFGNSTLTRYNPVTREILSYYFSDSAFPDLKWGNDLQINKIFDDREERLWLINTGAGIAFKFEIATENLSLYQVPRYIDFDCIRDNTGNFWFASVGQNMFRMVTDPLPIMTAPIPNGDFTEAADKCRMCQDTDGNLWLALSGGIFKMRDPAYDPGFRLEKLNLPEKKSEPLSVFDDRSGSLWFGLSKGIVLNYDPSGKSFKKFIIPPGNFAEDGGRINFISSDSSGDIWFATERNGLFMLPAKKSKIRPVIKLQDLEGSQPNTILLDFLIDSRDKIWLSTTDGLYRTDREFKNVRNYAGFDGTGRTYGSFYCRILEDRDNRIWVLNSLAGPYIYDFENDTFVRPPIPLVSSEMGFSDMLIDSKNTLWFSSYGIIKTYDQAGGASRAFILPEKAVEFHSFLLASGMRAFVTNNKLFIFPEKVPLNNSVPQVYITGLFINDKALNVVFKGARLPEDMKKIDLKYRQNDLRFEFAALNYTHPEENRYKYFMKGVDRDTVFAEPGMPAEYRKMPPGSYKFWVTGSNNDGLWNPDGVTIDIRIHPPWYSSALVRILYVVLILSLIAGYIRLKTHRLKTDKLRLETIVKERTEELEIRNRQLAESDRIKTHFFTDISHEIRTPLSLITGPLDTISKEETMSPGMSGMIETMKRNSQRLLHLVNQLLDISRLDAGKMKLNLINDDIVKCLRILVYEFLSAAESKQIRYIAEIPEKEFITWFDKDKIEKIISNLLSNALKYTPEKGTIECQVNIEEPDHEKKPNILYIKVKDTGPGIEKENLEKIFDRFFRVEGRIEAESQGTGIGLSLTREFTALMHGEIKVNSAPGKGSEFIISLPLGKDHLMGYEYITSLTETGKTVRKEIKSYPPPPSPEKKVGITENNLTVLIVEDNEDLRNFVRENLKGKYQVLGAENGRTGINLAFTMMPDIIVTDIMMPDIDGIQLCRTLKNDERTSHIPVILLTAKVTTEDKLEGLKSGADDYIIKPFIMDELLTRLANLLALREKLKLKYQNPAKSALIVENPESVDDRFMAKVIRVIGENLSNFNFDVGMLHERLGMSRMHLTRKLRILTGLSPHIFIRNIRLEKAAEMLMKNAGNITEIAYSVGFSNASRFAKVFREYFGVLPKKYSKQ